MQLNLYCPNKECNVGCCGLPRHRLGLTRQAAAMPTAAANHLLVIACRTPSMAGVAPSMDRAAARHNWRVLRGRVKPMRATRRIGPADAYGARVSHCGDSWRWGRCVGACERRVLTDEHALAPGHPILAPASKMFAPATDDMVFLHALLRDILGPQCASSAKLMTSGSRNILAGTCVGAELIEGSLWWPHSTAAVLDRNRILMMHRAPARCEIKRSNG